MKNPRGLLPWAFSVLVGGLIWEGGLRIVVRHENRSHTASATTGVERTAEAFEARAYVPSIPAATGTDREWFMEDPPPLPNRTAPAEEDTARYGEFGRRGLYPPQAIYVWNRYLVEAERCNPNGLLRNYPETVRAFTPSAVTFYPRYRFPASATAPEGLVTNAAGFRGRPLPWVKPAKTIRIAFVGSSTTIGNHEFPFSYPEFIEHWLNLYAQANHVDVRFEAVNAGREGISSRDIHAIVEQELLPLDPDLVVYYEGSNQFSRRLPTTPQFPARWDVAPADPVVEHKVPACFRNHLVTAELLDRILNGFRPLGEPLKPSYRLEWPARVNRRDPDPDEPDLPLQLPVIVKDLDAIRGGLDSIGGRLVLCSFVWFTPDDVLLSPQRHAFIYKQLNTQLWPLHYSDIRALADFQNLVFRNYAATRKIPFVDVAGRLPRDPNLFWDAVHMTQGGERLKAWIVFQQLVPFVRASIESGALPRAAGGQRLPARFSQIVSEMSTRCGPPAGSLVRLEGALSAGSLVSADGDTEVRSGHPTRITTGRRRWTTSARAALRIPAGSHGPYYLFVRARVLKGRAAVGVLDADRADSLPEMPLDPSDGMRDVYVPLPKPDTADALVVRNTAPEDGRSELLIDDLAVLSASDPRTAALASTPPGR